MACAALAAAAVAAYATAIEPNRLTVTRYHVRQGDLARVLAGRTVALLSDLHCRDNGEPLAAAALGLLGEIRPDLILLVGDYVAWGGRGRAYEHALDFLARLEAPLGVFAVLGDADATFPRRSCEFCHAPGSGAPTGRHRVRFLRDDQRIIATGRGDLRIVGLDAGRTPPPGTPRLQDLLGKGGDPTLLLSHSSVIFRGIDEGREVLVASGDTHGGQVRLPAWFWRLTRLKPDPAHISGFFREGRKALVVTRGVGTSRVRLRLGAPPEIVLLEFGAEG